ncbi:sigma-70 family RNA polymerase sigma factor [Micromonospora sp. NPDC049559]|uniref:sigma-70 family RNA polymerase sigma factor n=1 Tax=Micromonospora sp. NPDC049559 TaxID=3155923 RepID=UPI00341A4EC4
MTSTETTGEAFARLSDPFRRELLVHCYRMLGSIHEAEDVLQETLLRAWRSFDSFDPGRASLRTWLYRIATNACITALGQRRLRPLPSGLAGAAEHATVTLERDSDIPWLQPVPEFLLPRPVDPAAATVLRGSVRLALIAALQYLPARQRAVLILRDVLDWPAAEVAALLETSPAAVNSALQRARAQIAQSAPAQHDVTEPDDPGRRALLDRYVRAFEHADVDGLARLLSEDVKFEMPPFRTWFSGRSTVVGFVATHLFATAGLWRLLPTAANGAPAVATYLRKPDGLHHPHSVQVLSITGDSISRVVSFQDVSLFPTFDLPPSRGAHTP